MAFSLRKWAPEKVLEFCKYINEKEKINKDKILNQNIQLAEEGYRVIAIAQSKIHKRNFETKELEEKDLKDMIFLALLFQGANVIALILDTKDLE